MAVTLANSFEGVTPSGTALTGGAGGNTGGASGSFLDSVTIGTGATLASDNTHAAHGVLSLQAATSATTAQSFATWSASLTGTSLPTVWFRLYAYLTALPATGSWRLCAVNTATGLAAAVQVQSSTGLIRVINTSSATITTSVTAAPLNQWFRLEGFVTGSATAGQTELKIFLAADSTTPDETNTSTAAQNTAGAVNQVRFGQSAGALASYGPLWLDDLGTSDTGYTGPAAAPAPVSARARVGAYVTATPTPGTWQGGVLSAAITAWVADSGRQLTVWRSYQAFPTSVSADISNALNAGQKVVVSFKPTANTSIGIGNLSPLASATAQATLDANVSTWLTGLGSAVTAAGLDKSYVVIAMWVEPFTNNGIGGTGNSTFADFVILFRHYYTIISAAGFKVAWCTSAGNGLITNGEDASYPGDAFCDIVATDYYTGAYQSGSRISGYAPNDAGGLPPHGNNATYNPFYHADNASPKKPVGIYETGGTLALHNGITVTDFAHYMRDAMLYRASAGLPPGDICWFNSGNDANNTPIVNADGVTVSFGTDNDNGQTEIRNALFSNLFVTLDASVPPGLLIC